jgi:hypothetical protein
MPLAIIIVLGMLLLVVKKWLPGPDSHRDKGRTTNTTDSRDPSTAVDRNRGFDRRVGFIEYTKHAKCRMECRQISQNEVEEIMKDGTINYKKSNVNMRSCPVYSLEGTTRDSQRVRIVFGQCKDKTKVITCIDLNKDWQCHCPGD